MHYYKFVHRQCLLYFIALTPLNQFLTFLFPVIHKLLLHGTKPPGLHPSPSELEPAGPEVIERMEDGKVELAAVDLVKLAANKERVVDEPEEKYRFGCGPCAPACLQIFRNYIFFAFILYSFVILESCIASGMFERTCTNEYKKY